MKIGIILLFLALQACATQKPALALDMADSLKGQNFDAVVAKLGQPADTENASQGPTLKRAYWFLSDKEDGYQAPAHLYQLIFSDNKLVQIERAR